MLRVSSLGLKCRRQCSSHCVVLKRSRVAVPAGKAPTQEVTKEQEASRSVSQLGRIDFEVSFTVEGGAKASGQGEPQESTRKGAVTSPVLEEQIPRSHQDAGEDKRGPGHSIELLTRKTIRPLRVGVRRRSVVLPHNVEVASNFPANSPPHPRVESKTMQHINTARKFEKSIQALQCAEGSRVLTGQRKPAPAHTPNIALALLDEGEEGGLSAHSSCHTTRDDCLQTLATTNSLSDAWHAYETLLALPRDPACLHIPWEYLHRLTRLIASTKPRTRPLFIRLMSVVSTIHRTGGRVQLWQWNALVDFAGKGWRKTKQEDFRNAFDIYNDLVASRSPGATFLRSDPDADYGEKSLGNPEPDIVTLTTLLHIATRTMHKPTVQYAARLHQTSGLPPNRITLLTFLQYFTRKGDLAGIRHIISQMVAYDFDVGIDGVNAYIWAYGRNGRLDVAGAMYAILRARVFSSEGNDASTTAAVTYLQETERIVVPEGVVPDRITYTGLIQAYAFHGYLTRCLQVFNDYARMVKQSEDHKRQALFTLQMVPIYRAIFIGFTRHGRHHLSDRLQNLQSGVAPEPSAWNMETLEALFVDFLTIPADIKASPKMLYWIMVAFARTSGGDTMKLQEVFVRLRERFPHNWDGRLQRLWKKLFGKYQRPR